MPFEPEVGHTVAGKYELLRLLGRGSMGEVWLARHNTLAEEVAVKFLKIEMSPNDDLAMWVSRFLFEAQVAARLSRKSRHIVRVTDHGEESGTAYLVMERLEGTSLVERLGNLPLPDLRRVVIQVSRGLGQAHADGVFHRDLKPENIFLSSDEDGVILAKILDFGIAGALQKGRKPAASTTERGLILGTTSYMSPEQVQALKSLDHRCDLWALAVVTYELLTGFLPFVGETTEEVFASICMRRMISIGERRPDLGPDAERFFARAFAADIGDRFQSADSLATAFEAVSVTEGAEPPPIAASLAREVGVTQTHLTVSVRKAPRRAGAVAGGIAFGVCALIGALAGIRFVTRSEGAPPLTPNVVASPPSAPVEHVPAVSWTAVPTPIVPPDATQRPLPVVSRPPSVRPLLPAAVALPAAAPVSPPPIAPAAPSASAAPNKPFDKGEVF